MINYGMPPAPITLRPAAASDAARLASFAAHAFRAAFAADNDPADLEQYLNASFAPEQIAAEIADPQALFLLLFQDENLIGYTKLQFGRAPADQALERPVELVRIYVDPDRTARGLGSRLMQASLQAAQERGCATIWLGVWERNQRAIAFYERWGFDVIGKQQFTLGQDMQRDLVMSRFLPGQSE